MADGMVDARQGTFGTQRHLRPGVGIRHSPVYVAHHPQRHYHGRLHIVVLLDSHVGGTLEPEKPFRAYKDHPLGRQLQQRLHLGRLDRGHAQPLGARQLQPLRTPGLQALRSYPQGEQRLLRHRLCGPRRQPSGACNHQL